MASKKIIDKKFDSWSWRSPSNPRNEYDFEIRYKKGETVNDGPMAFYIKAEKPLMFHIEDGNLAVLRQKLDQIMLLNTEPTWQSYLLVHVDSTERVVDDKKGWQRHLEDNILEVGLEIKVSTLFVGVTPDGTKYRRRDMRSPAYEGEPDVGRLAGGGMKALVPDTPENRNALNIICGSLAAISTRVKGLMSPEEIVETLNKRSAAPFLGCEG